jgi:hypothetical protein
MLKLNRQQIFKAKGLALVSVLVFSVGIGSSTGPVSAYPTTLAPAGAAAQPAEFLSFAKVVGAGLAGGLAAWAVPAAAGAIGEPVGAAIGGAAGWLSGIAACMGGELGAEVGGWTDEGQPGIVANQVGNFVVTQMQQATAAWQASNLNVIYSMAYAAATAELNEDVNESFQLALLAGLIDASDLAGYNYMIGAILDALGLQEAACPYLAGGGPEVVTAVPVKAFD